MDGASSFPGIRLKSMKSALAIVGVTLITSCAGMRRQWEAQQAANAEQQRLGQPTNMEVLCKSIAQSYCSRCGQAGATCGETYIGCLNGNSPAAASGLSVGQVEQCSAEVSQGDCTVMSTAWPAACYAPQQNVTQATSQQTCEGGSVWSGDQCVCPEGTAWNGTQCVAEPPAATAPAPPPRPSRPNCRALVIQKGYGPSAAPQCQGVEAYCAEAVLNGGYGPSALSNCRGVDGACAVAVIQKGYGPSAVPRCRGIDRGCALAALDRGYGPSSLENCKHRR